MNLVIGFYHITTALAFIGLIGLIGDGTATIYGLWVTVMMITGSFLIEGLKKGDK